MAMICPMPRQAPRICGMLPRYAPSPALICGDAKAQTTQTRREGRVSADKMRISDRLAALIFSENPSRRKRIFRAGRSFGGTTPFSGGLPCNPKETP